MASDRTPSSSDPTQNTVDSGAAQENTENKCIGGSKEPPIIPNVIPAQPRDEQTEKCRYPHTPWWKTTVEIIGIAAVVFYAIVSYRQWQAQIENMKIEQRAWLGVVGITNFDFKAKSGFSIPFDMMNTGKTPALNVRSEVSFKSLEREKDFVATYDDPRPLKLSSYVLQPQMHTVLYTLPTDVSEKQYGDIANLRGILYGYGRITYDDIFGKEHHTTFCVMYWAGLPGPIACNTYNTAD